MTVIKESWVDQAGSDPRVVLTEAKISALCAIRAALDRLRVKNPDSETVKRLMQKAEYTPWTGGDEHGERKEIVS